MTDTSTTRTTWMVRVEFAGPTDADHEATAERLLDGLGLDVVSAEPGKVGSSMFVDEHDTWEGAAADVVARVGCALGGDWQPVNVHVLTEGEFDLEQSRPVYPPMVGLTEAAEILGVSRQRAGFLVKEGKMPTPIASLASGPVFAEAAVRAFAAQPRRAGRPAKAVASSAE